MNLNEGKQKFFVVYQITNLIDGKIYVGAHVTFSVNDKYMGSSKYLKKDIKEFGRQNFKKEILHIFNNKKDMMNKEAEIVNRKFCHRQDTYNRMVGGISELNWADMIVVKDNQGNIHSIYRDDPRYLSGELIGIAKGTAYRKGYTTVKDEHGNTFSISLNDPRYLSGELIPFGRGVSKNNGWNGKSHSEDTKEKQRAYAKTKIGKENSQFGTCWITREGENKKIKKEDLESYSLQGWIKGRV